MRNQMSDDWKARCNALDEDDINNFSLTGNTPKAAPTGFTEGQQRLYVRAFLADTYGIPEAHGMTPRDEQRYYNQYASLPQFMAAKSQIAAYAGQLAAMSNTVL